MYKGAKSAEASVTSGAIRGSFLGPTLLIGFINNLPELINARDMWLFADDSKTADTAASKTDCCAIQQNLNAPGECSLSNHLPLSIDKFVCLQYGLNNSGHTYNINGLTIKSVYQCSGRPWCALYIGFPILRPHRHDLYQGQQTFGYGSENI